MGRRNIGVAVSIPEPYGGQLQAWREKLGDPNAMLIVPHVTLLPPTLVPADDLPAIEEHLRVIAQGERPFEIHLRGTGTFRPVSPVVFVQLATGIGEMERIEAKVRSGPLARELRFPYHPHVTVVHDVPDDGLDRAFEALSDFEAQFPVWGFSLFEQTADGAWHPQRDLRFGAGGLPGPLEGHPAPVVEPGW